MRIFLDANVLFSAAKSDGAVRSLVTQLLDLRGTSAAWMATWPRKPAAIYS